MTKLRVAVRNTCNFLANRTFCCAEHHDTVGTGKRSAPTNRGHEWLMGNNKFIFSVDGKSPKQIFCACPKLLATCVRPKAVHYNFHPYTIQTAMLKLFFSFWSARTHAHTHTGTQYLSQAKPNQSSNWGRRLALLASRRPPVC